MNGDEKKKRRFFFRHGRRKRLEYIALLPSLVTLINGVCGFAAIGLAAKGPEHFTMAGVMIYLGMVADMLDGRLARMSHSTSSFGGQLDSLSDVLSFGAAPAFLGFKLLMGSLPILSSPSELLGDFIERLIWLASAIYLSCAAVRLARFNVENTDDETSHMSFSGLPTPAAASVVASMVILYQHLTGDTAKNTMLFAAGQWIIIHTLPFVMLWLAGLMVSRIRYPHVVNQYMRGKRPTTHLMWALVLGGMVWLCKMQMTIVVISVGFAASGFIKWAWYHTLLGRLFGHKPAMPATGVHPAHTESHS